MISLDKLEYIRQSIIQDLTRAENQVLKLLKNHSSYEEKKVLERLFDAVIRSQDDVRRSGLP